MTLFTQEEKEKLVLLLCSKDDESRQLGWDIIDWAYNSLSDEKDKRKFKNHLDHAKKAISQKVGWYYPYWEYIDKEPIVFEAFRKNILLLDIFHNPNEQN